MGECLVILYDEFSQTFSTLITDQIPSQAQSVDHLAITEEFAKQFNMFIIQVLVLSLNQSWLVDSPSFQSRLKAVTNFGVFIELNLDNRFHNSVDIVPIRLGTCKVPHPFS